MGDKNKYGKEDYTIISTPGQIEDFIKFSPIWKDIQNELKVWLDEIHLRLENNDVEFSSRELDRLGGSAEAIRNLQTFPEVLLINVKNDRKK